MSALTLRPGWRFVVSRPAHLLAFGFGAGLVPRVPGTAGTLLAFPLYALLGTRIGAAEFLLLLAALFALGVWACEATGRALGASDHGGMVWDEIVAFLLVLFFTPPGVAWQASAFALFRLFDILKPPPIRWLERRYRNGFGAMFDDLVAAFYTLIALALARTLLE